MFLIIRISLRILHPYDKTFNKLIYLDASLLWGHYNDAIHIMSPVNELIFQVLKNSNNNTYYLFLSFKGLSARQDSVRGIMELLVPFVKSMPAPNGKVLGV